MDSGIVKIEDASMGTRLEMKPTNAKADSRSSATRNARNPTEAKEKEPKVSIPRIRRRESKETAVSAVTLIRPQSPSRQRFPVPFSSASPEINPGPDDYSHTIVFKEYGDYCLRLVRQLADSADDFAWLETKTHHLSSALISAGIQLTLKPVGTLLGITHYPEELANRRAHESMTRQTISALANVICDHILDQAKDILGAPVETVAGLTLAPNLYDTPTPLLSRFASARSAARRSEIQLANIAATLAATNEHWRPYLQSLYTYYMMTTKAAYAFDDFLGEMGADLSQSNYATESLRRRAAYFRPAEWFSLDRLPLDHVAITSLLTLIQTTQDLLANQAELFFTGVYPFEKQARGNAEAIGFLGRFRDCLDSPVTVPLDMDSPRGQTLAMRNLFLLADGSQARDGAMEVREFLQRSRATREVSETVRTLQQTAALLETPALVSGISHLLDLTGITQRFLAGIVPRATAETALYILDKSSAAGTRAPELDAVIDTIFSQLELPEEALVRLGTNGQNEANHSLAHDDPGRLLGRPILALEAATGTSNRKPMALRLKTKAALERFQTVRKEVSSTVAMLTRTITSLVLPVAQLIGDLHRDSVFQKSFPVVLSYTCGQNTSMELESGGNGEEENANPLPAAALRRISSLISNHDKFLALETLIRLREADARAMSNILHGQATAKLMREYKFDCLLDDQGLLFNQPVLPLLLGAELTDAEASLTTTESSTLDRRTEPANSKQPLVLQVFYQTLLKKTQAAIAGILSESQQMIHSEGLVASAQEQKVEFIDDKTEWVTFHPPPKLPKSPTPAELASAGTITKYNADGSKEIDAEIIWRVFQPFCTITASAAGDARTNNVANMKAIVELLASTSFPFVFTLFTNKDLIEENDYRRLYTWMVADIMTLIVSFHIYTLIDLEALTFLASPLAQRPLLRTDADPAKDAYKRWRQRVASLAGTRHAAEAYFRVAPSVAESIDAYLKLVIDTGKNTGLATLMAFDSNEKSEHVRIKELLALLARLDRLSDWRQTEWAKSRLSRWNRLPFSEEGRFTIQLVAGHQLGIVTSSALANWLSGKAKEEKKEQEEKQSAAKPLAGGPEMPVMELDAFGRAYNSTQSVGNVIQQQLDDLAPRDLQTLANTLYTKSTVGVLSLLGEEVKTNTASGIGALVDKANTPSFLRLWTSGVFDTAIVKLGRVLAVARTKLSDEAVGAVLDEEAAEVKIDEQIPSTDYPRSFLGFLQTATERLTSVTRRRLVPLEETKRIEDNYAAAMKTYNDQLSSFQTQSAALEQQQRYAELGNSSVYTRTGAAVLDNFNGGTSLVPGQRSFFDVRGLIKSGKSQGWEWAKYAIKRYGRHFIRVTALIPAIGPITPEMWQYATIALELAFTGYTSWIRFRDVLAQLNWTSDVTYMTPAKSTAVNTQTIPSYLVKALASYSYLGFEPGAVEPAGSQVANGKWHGHLLRAARGEKYFKHELSEAGIVSLLGSLFQTPRVLVGAASQAGLTNLISTLLFHFLQQKNADPLTALGTLSGAVAATETTEYGTREALKRLVPDFAKTPTRFNQPSLSETAVSEAALEFDQQMAKFITSELTASIRHIDPVR